MSLLYLTFILERRENKQEWEWYEQNIVKYFENDLQLKQKISGKQVHRAIGLINVNAVALQFPKFFNSKKGKKGFCVVIIGKRKIYFLLP